MFNFSLPGILLPSVAPVGPGLTGGGIGPLGLTGTGLGGSRGGPIEFLLPGGREVGNGGGAFLGEEGPGKAKKAKNNSLSLTNSQYHYHGMFGQQFDVKLQLTRRNTFSCACNINGFPYFLL